MKFTKMHGLGNDFILINCMKAQLENLSELARKLCDRHSGIGADGLLLVLPSDRGDFRMRIFDSDGSEEDMCGNGMRCFAKYVYEKGLTKKKRLNIETPAGIREATIQYGKVESIKVDMGSPRLKKREVPVIFGDPETMLLDEEVNIPDYGKLRLTAVNTGVAHAVLFVEDIEKTDVVGLGSLIRNFTELFPLGINVNFAQVLERNHLRVRTYEQGVEDETLACGTGATAVGVSAVLQNRSDPNEIVKLDFKRGTIEVKVKMENGKITQVHMSGPATMVFDGILDI